MVLRAQIEPHIEVHKYYKGVVAGVAFTALMLQAFLPVYIPRANLLDLPLLITLYFGLSRRSPNAGLLLGMTIGLFQDAVSGSDVPLGLYGIAKTFVGYAASSIGGRLDVDHPLSRFCLTFGVFYLHQIIFAFTKRLLLAQGEVVFSMNLLVAALLNAALAVALFALLDRLRKPS